MIDLYFWATPNAFKILISGRGKAKLHAQTG